MPLLSTFSKSLTLPQSSYIKRSEEAATVLDGYAKVIMIKQALFGLYRSLLPSVHKMGITMALRRSSFGGDATTTNLDPAKYQRSSPKS